MNLSQPERERLEKARDILLRSAGIRKFAPLLYDLIKPGVAVHADRRVGKTEALLSVMYAETGGQAIVVVSDNILVDVTRERYNAMFNFEDAKSAFPVFMNSASAASSLRAWKLPVYVDEWWLIPASHQRSIKGTARVAGAVGTMPGLSGCIEAFPISVTAVEDRLSSAIDW